MCGHTGGLVRDAARPVLCISLLARICFDWAGGQTQPIAFSNQWVPCHGGFANDGCCLGLIALPETAAAVC